MKYMGVKSRIARQLADVITNISSERDRVILL